MKSIIIAVVLIALSTLSKAEVVFSGHADFQSLPAFGAWQSLESAEQTIGISKRLFHLDQGSQEMVRVGGFLGVSKAFLSQPGTSPHALGGFTLAIPGSLLDWALGTSLGDKWLPKLKTGILGAYDLSRFNDLKGRPNFIGLGLAYPLGS